MEDLTPHAVSAALCGDVKLCLVMTETMMLPAANMPSSCDWAMQHTVPLTVNYSSTCALSLNLDV